MNSVHPENANVLHYLASVHHRIGILSYFFPRKRRRPAFAPWNSVRNPYYRCGCHPEIVERLWDQLNSSLPADSRCLVYGTPALAHPRTGIILTIGIGTQYGLRLPISLVMEAIQAGAKTHITWSSGTSMDIQRVLGEDWVFGAWRAEELRWCKTVYEMFDAGA